MLHKITTPSYLVCDFAGCRSERDSVEGWLVGWFFLVLAGFAPYIYRQRLHSWAWLVYDGLIWDGLSPFRVV